MNQQDMIVACTMCPKCKVRAGHWCKTPSGKAKELHKERIERYNLLKNRRR